VHRTHGEVIAVRAERDRAALRALPEQPYVVCDRHTRRVGKDALVSFQASHYSVPWRQVRPGGRVELRVTPPRSQSGRWALASSCWPPTPAPSGVAAGWWTRLTGRAWRTAPMPRRHA
jgi:hypothetical protein